MALPSLFASPPIPSPSASRFRPSVPTPNGIIPIPISFPQAQPPLPTTFLTKAKRADQSCLWHVYTWPDGYDSTITTTTQACTVTPPHAVGTPNLLSVPATPTVFDPAVGNPLQEPATIVQPGYGVRATAARTNASEVLHMNQEGVLTLIIILAVVAFVLLLALVGCCVGCIIKKEEKKETKRTPTSSDGTRARKQSRDQGRRSPSQPQPSRVRQPRSETHALDGQQGPLRQQPEQIFVLVRDPTNQHS